MATSSTILKATATSDEQTIHADSSVSYSSAIIGFDNIEPALSPVDASVSHSSSQSDVNMLHLELLHHMSSVTWKDLAPGGTHSKVTFDAGIKIALDAPFLMYELLAVSALHLSTLRLAQQEFYRSEASNLQKKALAMFNNLNDGWISENTIPTFLFSAFVGIHVIFDTLLFRPSDFCGFIDNFVEHLRLHRGVYTVLGGPWNVLLESEITPMLRTRDLTQCQISGHNECGPLKALIQSRNLSQAAIEICVQEVERLQWVFDSSRKDEESIDGDMEADLTFAWPSTVSFEFTELLLQKLPEALAILAHYAVILHWKRNLWIVKDGGIFLIEAIMRHLGSYWEPWLDFPAREILAGSK